MISVSAEKSECQHSGKGPHPIGELRYGTVPRALALPPGADTDRIEGTFKNGVLHASLPKSDLAKQGERSIEVKAA